MTSPKTNKRIATLAGLLAIPGILSAGFTGTAAAAPDVNPFLNSDNWYCQWTTSDNNTGNFVFRDPATGQDTMYGDTCNYGQRITQQDLRAIGLPA